MPQTHLLSLLSDPDKGSGGSKVQDVSSQCHTVVQDTSDLSKHGPDELCPWWNVDTQQSLNGQGVGLLITHHGDIVQSVEIRQSLGLDM